MIDKLGIYHLARFGLFKIFMHVLLHFSFQQW